MKHLIGLIAAISAALPLVPGPALAEYKRCASPDPTDARVYCIERVYSGGYGVKRLVSSVWLNGYFRGNRLDVFSCFDRDIDFDSLAYRACVYFSPRFIPPSGQPRQPDFQRATLATGHPRRLFPYLVRWVHNGGKPMVKIMDITPDLQSVATRQGKRLYPECVATLTKFPAVWPLPAGIHRYNRAGSYRAPERA